VYVLSLNGSLPPDTFFLREGSAKVNNIRTLENSVVKLLNGFFTIMSKWFMANVALGTMGGSGKVKKFIMQCQNF
jgi:hypothetical protein